MNNVQQVYWLLPIVFILSGCGSIPREAAVAPPTVTPSRPPLACSNPGTLVRAEIEAPSRGYAYKYDVYLPPCYEIESTRAYPVLYLVPGRSSSPDTWFDAGAGVVADEMILDGSLPPFLIVTTENIDEDPLAESIINDVIPLVESSYRILDGRQYHAVGGGSLGGIAAYRVGFQLPDQFVSIGMFGSGLISGEEPRFNGWLNVLTPENKPRVFLNTGEGDPLMLQRAQVMAATLDAAEIENKLVVGDGGHNYDYWVSNLHEYFTWLAEDWE